jgi:hypothetical protein
MAWFWLAIVAFPEVQKKAQAELDEVVGRHRLPTFADYVRLPYIRALVKESLRWKTVDPLGELQVTILMHYLIQRPHRCTSPSYGGPSTKYVKYMNTELACDLRRMTSMRYCK